MWLSGSTIEGQLKENMLSDFGMAGGGDLGLIDEVDRGMRFNYKGLYYGWALYRGVDGV